MVRDFRFSVLVAVGLIGAGGLWSASDSFVQAQSGKSKVKPKPPTSPEVKKLDAKLEEVQGSFLRDTVSIIKGYEDTGQLDRAKTLLEVLLKLDPKNEQIKKKIEQLNDNILDSSEFDIDLDTSKSWQQVGVVSKDRLIRLTVEGEYKFVASLSVGADGFSTKDPANDLIGGAPLGSVIGIIIPPGGADPGNNQANNQGGNNQNGKAPTPFTVGMKFEEAAKQDGVLLIRVNVPPGSKCTGKLKIKVGGVTKA